MSYYAPGGGMDQENAAIRRRNEFRYQMALADRGGGTAPGGGGGGGGGGLTPEARSAYGSAIDQYAPGGGYMKGIEAGLGRGRTKALASGMQNLVSAGMSNVTTAGGLGKKFEEEVGAPTRAMAESERSRNLANIYASMGGAEQSAFESGANRRVSLTQTAMSQMPRAQTPQVTRTPNPYIRQPMSGGGGGGGGGGYQALLPGKSYFS